MKRLALLLLVAAPALALPAPQPGPRPSGDDAAEAREQAKRLRLARTLGLAEALDLDEAGALRARDVLARFDDRKRPLRTQVRDDLRVLRDAARGDPAAAAQVDPALERLRAAREKLRALDAEMLAELTKGATPEKRARAALFLARFREGAARLGRGPGAGRGGPRGRFGGAMEPGGAPGPGPGLGPPPGHGPAARGEVGAVSRSGALDDAPDDWFADE